MGAMVLPAGAQQSDRSIIFSTPQTDDAQAATPSLSPQNSQLPILPGSLQAPDPAFNFRAPNDFPAAQPAAPILHDQRMKKMLEDRKNWTLMTPAEIIGVTPTEELLQPPERDATGREKKQQTQLERYLERENRPRGGLTNGWQHGQDNLPWNFSRDRNDLNTFDTRHNSADQDGLNTFDPRRDSTIDAAQRLNAYLNGRRVGDGSVNRNDKFFGGDSFNPPPQMTAKPDSEQAAAMDRFRQLLESSPATAAGSSPDGKFFPTPKAIPVSDPYITQPDFVPNPAGTSFTPLMTGFGKPTGLSPLPGIVTPGIAPATVPAWAPQTAPWLSQGPQPFVVPQRKF